MIAASQVKRFAGVALAALSCATNAREPTSVDALSFYRCDHVDANGRSVGADAPCPKYRVSLQQLLARPELFDGKRVVVQGFVHLEFEGRGLYPSEAAYKEHVDDAAVWFGEVLPSARVKDCQDRFVYAEGTFRARDHGHFGVWGAALSDISLCAAR